MAGNLGVSERGKKACTCVCANARRLTDGPLCTRAAERSTFRERPSSRSALSSVSSRVCSRHVPGGHHSSPAAPTPPGALSLSVGPRTLSVPGCTRRPRRAGPFLLTEGSKETARRPPKEGRKWFRLHPCDNTELKRSRSAAGASALESGELNADPSRPCVSAAPVSSAAAGPHAHAASGRPLLSEMSLLPFPPHTHLRHNSSSNSYRRNGPFG